MSQSAARRKLKLRQARVRVEARFREQGSILAGTKQGSCQGFKIELILAGDQEPDEIKDLIRVAHQMCFTEDALQREVSLETIHQFNGEPFTIED